MPTTQQQTTEQVRRVLENPNSFTSPLTVLLLDLFGSDYFTWEPAALLKDLEEDYRAILPQIVFDRIQVGIQLLTSNAFYKSLPDFIQSANVMAGYPVGNGEFMPADVLSSAWAITEALLLSPPDDGDDQPFSQEILAYLGEMLNEEGIANPPDILRMAIRPPVDESLFSDDADMFAAVKSLDASKNAEITALLKRALTEMIEQLFQLPLAHGDVRSVATRFRSALERI